MRTISKNKQATIKVLINSFRKKLLLYRFQAAADSRSAEELQQIAEKIKRRFEIMNTETKVFTKVEPMRNGKNKLSKVIRFGNGNSVEIPINKDGSIRWFDDSKLLRK